MSWHYLQGQVAESWEADSLAGAPDALLRLIHTAAPSCSNDNETEFSTHSRSGTTSERSMADHGAEESRSSAEDSPAKTSAQLTTTQRDWEDRARASGLRWRELLAKYGLRLSLSRTPRVCALVDSPQSSEDWPSWGITLDGVCWELATSAPRTGETACGYWPTPTTAGNENSQSMLKWPAHRRMFVALETGGLSLDLREWLMGWPIGWTALEPLATDRYQQWLRLHGGC